MTNPCSVRVHPRRTGSRGEAQKSSGSSSSSANIERRGYATGGGGRGFRIRCRVRGLLTRNVDEAGVWGGVDDGVEGIEEVFPIVLPTI